jgi:hypothetical protein
MTIKTILFIFILSGSFTLFGYNIRRLISYLKIGKPEDRLSNSSQRIKNVLSIAIGQTKLLREPVAGVMHFLIFWGFVILLLAIVESIGGGLHDGFDFSFLGVAYIYLSLLQELVGLLVIG